MNSLRLSLVFGLFLLCSTTVPSQSSATQQPSTPTQDLDPKLFQRPSPSDNSAKQNTTPQQIELTLPLGTAIRIALSRRVRIEHEGTPVEGRVTETVYAFDQPVIPAGSQVRGYVARIEPISKMRRTM